MGLKDILENEIKQGKFKREGEIKIIGKKDDIDPTKYCTAERAGILGYTCFDATIIKRDALDRKAVEGYLEKMLPGFDSFDLYVTTFMNICKQLGVGNMDLIADNLLSNQSLDVTLLYERKGHYFTSEDGNGYDVTEFVEEHLREFVGIRHGENEWDYKLYILFAKQ